METYSTEEERLEALQRWWKENKQSLFAGLVMGLLIIGGWKLWQNHQRTQNEEASWIYHQLTEANQKGANDASQKLAERIIKDYGSTTYSAYARLFLAKSKMDSNDLKGAQQTLEEALKKADDEEMENLTRLRLAKVLLAQPGEATKALSILDAVPAKKQGKFKGLYLEARGNALSLLGRSAEARAAFEGALQQGEPSPLLELKINDIPVNN